MSGIQGRIRILKYDLHLFAIFFSFFVRQPVFPVISSCHPFSIVKDLSISGLVDLEDFFSQSEFSTSGFSYNA